MDTGRLIARLVIGGTFVGHGTQKLFGWFGGPGLDNTAGMMESLEPASRAAAGATLTGTMATVVRTVHLDRTGRRG